MSGRAGLRPAYPGRAKQRHCAQGRHIAEFIPHACTTWLTHKNDAYLLHVYRGRLEYPELRRKVIGLATEHRATTVLIENAGPGMNLLQDLRAAMPQGMTRPIGVKPEGSKVDRMAAQSAKIEAGHVHLPNSAPWLGRLPHGAFVISKRSSR